MDGFQTLATNSLKLSSSNLLLVSQELFRKDCKKVSGIDISSNFRNFVTKKFIQEFLEFGYHTRRHKYDI